MWGQFCSISLTCLPVQPVKSAYFFCYVWLDFSEILVILSVVSLHISSDQTRTKKSLLLSNREVCIVMLYSELETCL